MVKKWDLIYDLRDDVERVRHVQDESTRSSAPYLFGSEEWCVAIDADTIVRRSVEGTLTETQPTSMPDPQEFRMRTEDGSELSGVRHGDPTRYVEGLHIRFDYMNVERTPDAELDRGAMADVIIAVWIEHSHKRTPYLHSFYPSPPGPI